MKITDIINVIELQNGVVIDNIASFLVIDEECANVRKSASGAGFIFSPADNKENENVANDAAEAYFINKVEKILSQNFNKEYINKFLVCSGFKTIKEYAKDCFNNGGLFSHSHYKVVVSNSNTIVQ